MFSFGSIKLATAFGGGIARVKSAQILKEMEALQAAYPTYTRVEFLKKATSRSTLGVYSSVYTVRQEHVDHDFAKRAPCNKRTS